MNKQHGASTATAPANDDDAMACCTAHVKVINDDILCIQCDYNLRGTSPQAACPECGTEIRQSFHDNLLRFSDPKWLGVVTSGAGLYCLWMMLSACFYGMTVSAILNSMGGASGHQPTPGYLYFSLNAILNVVGVAAVWLLTRPETAKTDDHTACVTRRWARGTIIASVLMNIACWILFPDSQTSPIGGILFAATLCLWVLLMLINTIVVLVRLRSLALRMPNLRLANKTQIAKGGFIVGSCFLIPGLVLIAAAINMDHFLLYKANDAARLFHLTEICGVMGAMAFFVGAFMICGSGILAFVLYVSYGSQLKNALHDAVTNRMSAQTRPAIDAMSVE